MKTPKREYYFYDSGINPENGDIIMDAVMPELYNTRWKRKNRTAQLKRTIAILKHRLKDTEETLRLTQKITKCFIVKPDHWHHLDENGNELTRKQWRVKTKIEKAACHPETDESGQQTDLPPTGGQQDRKAQR